MKVRGLILVCAVAVTAAASRQLFVNLDANPATGYAADGVDIVCREAGLEHGAGPGGWGRRVPCYVEIYGTAGNYVEAWPYRCEAVCKADYDGDGDQDLADFAAWLETFGGPEGGKKR